VQAEDRDELLDWLRPQKLVHVDRELGWMMARLGAEVDHADGRKHAAEVEVQLHGAGYRKLFRNMYGDKPSWAPNLSGYDRSRAIINVLTRMRRTRAGIGIETAHAGHAGTGAVSLVRSAGPGRARPRWSGHWSALGLTITRRARHRHWRGLGRHRAKRMFDSCVVQVRADAGTSAQRPAHRATGARAPRRWTQGKEQGGNAAAPARGPRRRRRRGGGAARWRHQQQSPPQA
jgi:bis(5'-nucleosyl)-tetraphosphatase (symmetrical)